MTRTWKASTDAKAITALGVFYLPLPLPRFDVYAKAGAARVQERTSASGSFGCLANCPLMIGTFNRNDTSTRFVYGAGVQIRFGRLGVRAEYERVDASSGDPDLMSVGAVWNF